MFCAICTSDIGPLHVEKMDGKSVVVCDKCCTAPAHHYSFSAATLASSGRDGVGAGNRRHTAKGRGV